MWIAGHGRGHRLMDSCTSPPSSMTYYSAKAQSFFHTFYYCTLYEKYLKLNTYKNIYLHIFKYIFTYIYLNIYLNI